MCCKNVRENYRLGESRLPSDVGNISVITKAIGTHLELIDDPGRDSD